MSTVSTLSVADTLVLSLSVAIARESLEKKNVEGNREEDKPAERII